MTDPIKERFDQTTSVSMPTPNLPDAVKRGQRVRRARVWRVTLAAGVLLATLGGSAALYLSRPTFDADGAGSAATKPRDQATRGPTPTKEKNQAQQDHQTGPAGVVYYRLHPDPKKVDRHCGAYDRSYIERRVQVPETERAVLKRALQDLFHEVWLTPRSRIRAVDLAEGHVVIDLSSLGELEFATTSCGGVEFAGSIMRTVFQFESIHSFEIRLQGSCRRLGELMQSERCRVYTRDDL